MREESLPNAGWSLPIRPGEPARVSPRLRETTLSDRQSTPVKLVQGSDVKSQVEKKVEPWKSSSDFRINCRARKSTGCKIALEKTVK